MLINPRLVSPTVSIVICNHNYARFLEAALESAVAQSYPCEVVVVDDGSSDGSHEILRAWETRVKIVHQANLGQRAAYNNGFSNCGGDVVLFLDSDDLLQRDALSQIVEAFDEGVVKVHFRMALVDEHGKSLGSTIPTILAEGNLVDQLRKGVLYSSAPGSGNAYRRSALTQLFPIPTHETDFHGADFFLIYGCIAFGAVRAIRKVLACYRVHSVTASGAMMFGNAAQTADEFARFLTRVSQFNSWIAARTNGEVTPPSDLRDFSLAKAVYVRSIFEDPIYSAGLERGSKELPLLLQLLWRTHAYSVPVKLLLSSWALFILLAPRPIGRPAARYVANPASR